MTSPCDEGMFYTRSSCVGVIFGLDGAPLAETCILGQIIMQQCTMLANSEPAGRA